MFKLIVPDEEQLPQRLDECVILLRAKEKPCSSAKNDNRLGRYDLASFLSAIRILLRISCWFAADSTDSASLISANICVPTIFTFEGFAVVCINK